MGAMPVPVAMNTASRTGFFKRNIRAAMEIDQSASFEIAEVVGEESVGNAVEADVEGALIARRRSDGIGARDFASIVQGLHGNKLAGNKVEGAGSTSNRRCLV